MTKPKDCTCVYATAANTPSVRDGVEMGGYLKEECAACKAKYPEQAEGAQGEPKPVLWFRALVGAECRADGRCYDVVFCEMPGYEPLYRQARAALAQPSPKCATCGGTGMVDDGEIWCSEGGIPYENGPVKCVKDCPACKAHPSPAPELERPEVVGYLLAKGNGTLSIIRAGSNDEPVMTVAQHAAIVAKWAELLNRANDRADAAQARVAELEKQEPVIYWVLYDATADQKFIKKMLPEGFLGFFDNEQEAQRAKNNNPGTDFKRVEYYKAPVAQAGQEPVGYRARFLKEPEKWMSNWGMPVPANPNPAAEYQLLYAAPVAPSWAAPEGMRLVPLNPTEEQWGGLARAIVFWMRSYPSNKHTPATLVEFITSLGHAVPEWMGDENELRATDHVISKGTIAVLIYKAMLAAAPAQGGE